MKKLIIILSVLTTLVIFSTEKIYAQQTECKVLGRFLPGNPKIERKGNLFIVRRESEYGNSVMVRISENLIEKTASSQCEILELSLRADFEGGKIAPTDKIELSFDSISNKFMYDSAENRSIKFQADGKEVFSAELEQGARNELSDKIKREYLRTDKNITFADLKNLAEAKNITLQIGKKILKLTAAQHQSLKGFYKELNNPEVNEQTSGYLTAFPDMGR